MVTSRKTEKEEKVMRKLRTSPFSMLLIALVLLRTSPFLSLLYADFEPLGWSAASAGMSDAAMLSKKIPSLFYINPAASSYFEKPVIGMEYENMYPGLSDSSGLSRNIMTYTHKLEGAGCGAGAEKFSLDNLYSESTYLINYSKNFRQRWFAGGNLRILQKKYGSDLYTSNAINSDGSASGAADPLFAVNGTGLTTFTLDAGFSRLFDGGWALSSVASFITSPDTSLGGGYKRKPDLSAGAVYETESITVGETLRFSQGNYWFDTGFEKRLKNEALKLRGGLSVGSGELKLFSAGLGYLHLERVSFDYAFVYPISGIKDSQGRHRVSASFVFGGGKEKTEEAILSEKTDLEKLLEQARAAFAEERWKDAVDFARKVLLIEPEHAEALEIFSEASEKLRPLLEPRARDAERLVNEGRFAEAELKYAEALDINPWDERLRESLEKIKRVTAVSPQALGEDRIAHLTRLAVRSYMSNDQSSAVNAVVYLTQLDKSIVSESVRNIVRNDFSAKYRELRLIRGMNLVEQKLYSALKNIYNARYDLAIIECNEALELEPRNVLALTRLGSAYYALGKKEKAIEVWREALKYDPGNQDILEFMRIPPETSIKEVYQTKQSEDADSLLQIKKLYLQGVAAEKRGEYENAKLLFKEASEIRGGGDEGEEYRRKAAENLKAVRRQIEEGNEKTQRLMKAHYSAGVSYYNNGRYSEAISEFRKLLAIKPGHEQSLKMIDLCRQKMEK